MKEYCSINTDIETDYVVRYTQEHLNLLESSGYSVSYFKIEISIIFES